ncbi:MAG: formylglycine-generating enzyme family protein [Magnetococcales bacterium]|nr:formylglycine-generating enzyme family protein [Magnetococcales bacterium]
MMFYGPRKPLLLITLLLGLQATLFAEESHHSPQEWREPLTGMRFVQLSGGCYQMGSEEPALGARPVHQVCLEPFWLSRYETSNAEYNLCVAAGACSAPERRDSGINEHFRTGKEDHYETMGEALTAANHPVVGISWQDAQQFARWISERSGERFRLPTEAEWEYACRAGATEPLSAQPAGWYGENSLGKTHAGGEQAANAFGLHDMNGNVWEWVQDHHDAQGYTQHALHSPVFTKEGMFHVTRGGSWSSALIYLHCAYRGVGEERDRDDNLGFRLVREHNKSK